MRGHLALCCALSLAFGAPTFAQNAQQTCAKMEAEARLGPLTKAQCECTYAVALKVLDPDIQELLFDAWYTGANNMAKVEQLKPRARVERQFRTMANTLQRTCK